MHTAMLVAPLWMGLAKGVFKKIGAQEDMGVGHSASKVDWSAVGGYLEPRPGSKGQIHRRI